MSAGAEARQAWARVLFHDAEEAAALEPLLDEALELAAALGITVREAWRIVRTPPAPLSFAERVHLDELTPPPPFPGTYEAP